MGVYIEGDGGTTQLLVKELIVAWFDFGVVWSHIKRTHVFDWNAFD